MDDFSCDICFHPMSVHNFHGQFQLGCEECHKELKPTDTMDKALHEFTSKKLDILKNLENKDK